MSDPWRQYVRLTPNFDQTVLDMVVIHGLTLERLAVIGVLVPSQIDKYEMMLNPAKEVVIAESPEPDDDPSDIESALQLIYRKGEGEWGLFA